MELRGVVAAALEQNEKTAIEGTKRKGRYNLYAGKEGKEREAHSVAGGSKVLDPCRSHQKKGCPKSRH